VAACPVRKVLAAVGLGIGVVAGPEHGERSVPD
jgi:hypothetical protein